MDQHEDPEQNPDQYREEELVLAAQQGRQEAFAALYEMHVDRVYRYLVARLGQPADAEDVTAEVFIRAMKALPSYKPKGTPLMAWLYRIAHNQAVNHLKKRSRRPEAPLEDIVAAPDDPAAEALHRASYGEAIRAAEGLTDLQQQVLSLRFAGELSISETAKVMKRNEGAVKFLQHSALRALRRILEQQGAVSHGS
jgi:RNA polymerase sigma-70 factor (ECF subfamily)